MSEAVQSMFSRIAPRYDVTNDVLSFGIHRLWREKAVKDVLRAFPPDKELSILDLCTGTGDVAFSFERHAPKTAEIIATDFCEPMLEIARKKQHNSRVKFSQADAMSLPFEVDRFDIISMSFGIRNVDDPLTSLRECLRVGKPGAQLLIIEFGRPTFPVFSELYSFYQRYFMPHIGGFLTGDKSAYEYLPETSRAFPAGEQFLELMRQAGFRESRFTPLMSGLAYIYRGQIPPP